MRRALAFALKEWRKKSRGAEIIFLVVIQPLMFCLVWGYCASTELGTVRLALLDQSRSGASRALVRHLEASGSFAVSRRVESRAELERALVSGSESMALVVPPDFARGGRPVEIIADGADPNIASLGVSYALSTTRAALAAPAPAASLRAWYNPSLRSADLLLIGALAYNLLFFLMYPASSLVIEKRRGSLQVLAASPIRVHEIWLGIVLTNGAIALWGTLIQLGLMMFLVGIPVRGDGLALLAGVALLLVIHLNLGCALSLIARTDTQVTVYGLIFVLLSISLSGFLVPSAYLPEWTQRVGAFVPLKPGLDLLRAIVLKGGQASRELALLLGFAIGTTGLALVSLRRLVRAE